MGKWLINAPLFTGQKVGLSLTGLTPNIMQIKVGASILSADFTRLSDELKECEQAGIDYIHLDIMDGHFVPNITFGLVVVKAIRSATTLPLDAHLMIENPEKYIPDFIKAGVDMITVHSECFGKLTSASDNYWEFPKEITSLDVAQIRPVLKMIKSAGKKAFVALNPGTPLCINEILGEIDGVLIMSVNPGFAGQSFNRTVLSKITALRAKYQGDIQVDGGVNDRTAPEVIKAGANLLVTASYFFNAPDKNKAVTGLKKL